MTAPTTHSAVVTLPSDTEILITRSFAAPRALVWRAYTTPDLVRRWWHARRGEMTACDIDLRPGGRWRYAMTAHGGFEVAFHGEFREVVAEEKLVTTEVFEGMPDASALTTATFRDLAGGGTELTLLVQHQAREHRDAHIASGMEDGLQDALDMIEEVALSLQ